MIFAVCCVGVGLSFGLFIYYLVMTKRLANERVYRPLDNGQRIEVDPDDPTDPMHDPAVRAMFSEVIRTGRPMHMVRGEKPTFVDEPSDTSNTATETK